jgi:hypothetical protein
MTVGTSVKLLIKTEYLHAQTNPHKKHKGRALYSAEDNMTSVCAFKIQYEKVSNNTARWVKSSFEEAEYIEAETNHPDGIHSSCAVRRIDEETRRFLIKHREGRQLGRVSYVSLCRKITARELTEDQIPLLIRRCMKAKGLEAVRRYGSNNKYVLDWGYDVMAGLEVEPLIESSPLPDLRPKLFEKTKKGFTFKAPKGCTHPKNLEHLPNWLTVKVEPYNSLSDYVTELTIKKPITPGLVEELNKLAKEVDHSLRNSDRRIAGEDVLMCSTLYFIYKSAMFSVSKALDLALKDTKGDVSKATALLNSGTPPDYRVD